MRPVRAPVPDHAQGAATLRPVPDHAQGAATLQMPLPAHHRYAYACASIGVWGPLVSFALLRTTAYIIYLGADATAIGAVGIVMGWWNALNGPFVARWADAGLLNRLRPFADWGRRAPWLLVGTPMIVLGTSLLWLPPGLDDTTLAAWYALCYFLVVNGATCQLQAYLSGIQELYPTAAERSGAIALQQPFLLSAYILAGVALPRIAFSFTPDTAESCCVAPEPDCAAAPLPCPCYANESAAPSAPAANLSAFFADAYATACGARLAELSAEEAGAERVDACADAGGSQLRSRFAAAAALVCAMGFVAVLAVAPARRTPVRLSEEAPPPLALCASLRATFERLPFRIFAGLSFLNQLYSSFVASVLPLYLVYVTRLDVSRLGTNLALLVAATLGVRLLFTPLWLRLLTRAHPARLVAAARLAEGLALPALVHALTQPWARTEYVMLAAGGLVGVCESPLEMINHVLIGWVIDEDSHARGGLRREGMFWACNGVCQHLSEVVLAALLGLFGLAGLDSRRCADAQPRAAHDAIKLSMTWGPPALCLSMSALALTFPIRGERLRALKQAVAAAATAEARVVEVAPSGEAAAAKTSDAAAVAMAPAPATREV